MPSPTPRRRAVPARLEELFTIALRLISEKGFRGVTMRDLAQSMGIKEPSLYNYLTEKDELLVRLLRPHIRQLCVSAQAIVDSEQSAAAKLRAFIRNHMEQYRTHHLPLTILFQEKVYLLNSKHRAWYRTSSRRYEEILQRLLRDGMGRGEFVRDDPRLCAYLVLGACNSSLSWYRSEGSISLEGMITRFTETLVRGLLPPTGLPRAANPPPAPSDAAGTSPRRRAARRRETTPSGTPARRRRLGRAAGGRGDDGGAA